MTIQPFTPESFAEALANLYTSPAVIKTKSHFGYFLKYLGEEGLQAQYMVIEEDYISRDYLHDYAAYYSLCFTKYPKFCRRIHFFKTTITEELINKAILEKENVTEDFWENYLGFIVTKPIPTTVIGFTVLKNYNTSPDRYWWGLRDYKVHFFGVKRRIRSLAFQEQDSVLAACATTAIWSMLNKASDSPHTVLKTPSEITRDAAGNLSTDGSRLFPNRGLSVLQICRAIFHAGLVSEVKQPDIGEFETREGKDGIEEKILTDTFVSNLYTKKILNAYSSIGIPVILVIRVPGDTNHDLHAIAVTGHRRPPLLPKDPQDDNSWIAETIDRIYAHDDQWGPFVKIDLENDGDLKTPWTENHPHAIPTRVTNIVIPVFPKVRISYEDIEAIVIGLDGMLTMFFDKMNKHDLVWDIKICYSESFKQEIKSSSLDEPAKLDMLKASLPKYLWIADCYIGTHKVFQVTFDATDVNNGMIGEHLVCYLPMEQTKELLDFLVRNERILKSVSAERSGLHYYEFVVENLRKQTREEAIVT